jgi:hypothetical protein
MVDCELHFNCRFFPLNVLVFVAERLDSFLEISLLWQWTSVVRKAKEKKDFFSFASETKINPSSTNV